MRVEQKIVEVMLERKIESGKQRIETESGTLGRWARDRGSGGNRSYAGQSGDA